VDDSIDASQPGDGGIDDALQRALVKHIGRAHLGRRGSRCPTLVSHLVEGTGCAGQQDQVVTTLGQS
jgi:hypothetical protein